MLRILAFFLVVLAGGLGFAWLADHPGSVSILWQGQEVGTSFTVFVILQLALVAAAVLLFWLVRGFFKAPDRVSRFFSSRRRFLLVARLTPVPAVPTLPALPVYRVNRLAEVLTRELAATETSSGMLPPSMPPPARSPS